MSDETLAADAAQRLGELCTHEGKPWQRSFPPTPKKLCVLPCGFSYVICEVCGHEDLEKFLASLHEFLGINVETKE